MLVHSLSLKSIHDLNRTIKFTGVANNELPDHIWHSCQSVSDNVEHFLRSNGKLGPWEKILLQNAELLLDQKHMPRLALALVVRALEIASIRNCGVISALHYLAQVSRLRPQQLRAKY
jgi:hypothetical protein